MIVSNYSETRRLLKKYDAHAKKHFGQNFIIDPSVVKTIAQKCGTDSETVCLEIGAGMGSLTQQLSLTSKHVYAFEIDPLMISILDETLQGYSNTTVFFADFLKADLSFLSSQERVVVCANVPYYITTPILFKLLESPVQFESMTLMMQKEIADRLNAEPKTKQYSSLSILFQYFFTMKKIMSVSKQSFYPQPNVDSSVLQFIPKPERINQASEAFFDFVHRCFNQRRKTIQNNLKNIGYSDEAIQGLKLEGIDLSVRPEAMDVHDYLKIYALLENTVQDK